MNCLILQFSTSMRCSGLFYLMIHWLYMLQWIVSNRCYVRLDTAVLWIYESDECVALSATVVATINESLVDFSLISSHECWFDSCLATPVLVHSIMLRSVS